MKGRKIANRPGLTKKKIRGKDGKTRTYWVKTGQSVPGAGQPPSKASPGSGVRTGFPLPIAGGVAKASIGISAALAATTMASYLGLKMGVENISAKKEDFLWAENPEDHEEIKRRYAEFKPGDLLERSFVTQVGVGELVAKHYAVYMGINPETGKHTIVHATASPEGKPIVGLDTMEFKYEGQSAFQKVEVPPPTDKQIARGAPKSREEILARAMAVVGMPHKYQVLKSNCESIARGIVQGEATSDQAQRRDLVTQIGGRFMTQVSARKFWEPESITAPEMTEQLNLLTLESRKDGFVLNEEERRVATPKEINDVLDRFSKGSVGKEMQVKILSEWLVTLASLSKKNKGQTRKDTRSRPCPGGYRIPLKKKCKGEGRGAALLGQAKETMKNIASDPGVQTKAASLAVAAAIGSPAVRDRVQGAKDEIADRMRDVVREKVKEIGDVIKEEAGNEFIEEQIDVVSSAVKERVQKEIARKVEEVQEGVVRPFKNAGDKLLEMDAKAKASAKGVWQSIVAGVERIGKRGTKQDSFSVRFRGRAARNYRSLALDSLRHDETSKRADRGDSNPILLNSRSPYSLSQRGLMNRYDSFDACADIRDLYSPQRMDAGRKGKQCPGGYWIPANKQCGKGGKGGAKMRSPGGGKLGRNLAIGAAGLATVGGAGALAYQNRDKIVKGVDEAGKAVRKGTRAAVGKANEMIGGHQAKSQQEEMNKRELMQRVSAAGRGIERATGMASRTARNVSAGAENIVGRVKGAVSGTIDKARQIYSGVTGGGKKKEEGK